MSSVNYKDDVLIRIYLIFAIMAAIAGALAYKTVDIAIVDREINLEKGAEYFQEREVKPERGNIYSRNNNLLATSVPYFTLHFDPFVAPPRTYYDNIDSLAYLLSLHVDNTHTTGDWRDSLTFMRDSFSKPARHYYKIAESVSYRELQRIKRFPIFNLGRFGGGFIVSKRDERKRPFGWLARRTIGKIDGKKVGIENTFDEELAGVSGKAQMFSISKTDDVWLPTDNLAIVEPTAGADVYTTIDVNIQDITENALHRAMRKHRPDWGAAVVMDVKTGAIRAIANLGMNTTRTKYFEQYNYAIQRSTEPGSTFKLATMMALLEDDKVTLDGDIDIERGVKEFSKDKVKVTDSNPMSKHWNVISIRQAFEQSSNVAMAKLADSLYADGEFSARLNSFHLSEKTGIELSGEGTPMINDTSRAEWSGISNAWLSFGYESRLTPLQMLTFFNTVANGGKMMKPYVVDEVRREGKTLTDFRPTVVDPQIASQQTIEQLQTLLEGVVERGTAKKLKSDRYHFAGKTGTSQQNYGKRGRKREYQASFVGYFPAEKPVYSVIVVIYNPTQGGYYGGEVAGPVFREIADNIYNSMITVHDALNQGPRPVLYAAQLPNRDAGNLAEITTILDYVNVKLDSLPASELAVVDAADERVVVKPWDPAAQQWPNVRGMRLRDAVYVLENNGYKVHPKGVGRVTDQKWHTDGKGKRGRDVTLFLN